MTGDFTYSYAGAADLGNHSYSEILRITQHGKVGIGSDIPNRPLSVGLGDGSVALHGSNAGIYIGTHPTGGFINNAAIARAASSNFHVSGSTAGDLCIASEAAQSMIFGLSHTAGAMDQAIHISRLRQFNIYYGTQSIRICLLYTSPSPRDS